jgi:UPF0755 protein
MRKILKIAKTALVGAQVVLLAGWVWLGLEKRARAANPAGGRAPVLFEVRKGRSVGAVVTDLREAGVLSKRTPFVLAYDLFFAPRNVKAGEYELPPEGRTLDILERLVEGRIVLHPVTVPEGLTLKETVSRLAAEGFAPLADLEAAAHDTSDIALLDPEANDLEGYLFPETYHFPKGATAADILRRMTSQFREEFDATLRAKAAARRMSVRETVILASLIEKETALPAEQKLVSAVFHNRLARGMKLDCDPTLIYGLTLRGPFEGRLRTKDLKTDTPYNTYLHAGLPPGPICSPGRGSLEAAVEPAEADYLYFVSRNDGSHEFNRSLAEHNRAVRKYHPPIGR